MAEAILSDIAAKIIESLGSQALKEIGLLWGVTDELEKLKNTFSTIQAVLLDADKEQWAKNNHEVRDWLEKLEDVVYDIDDLLDGFNTDCLLREMMTQDKMAKKVRNFFSKSNQLVYNFKMGRDIKAIRQKLDAISNDKIKFHSEQRPVEIGVRARKRDDTHSFVPEAQVIGREDAKEEIINKLLFDSNVRENVGILPITGIGGLGKTTLAQLIFNDEAIDKHFHELKMWVCVSDNFDVRKVVEKILKTATKKKPESVEMETLVHDLQKEISGKKYLLVLDDVWNEDPVKWDELKKLLMSGASGSRILVTTRSAEVARITTQTIEPYSLQGLDSQKSWSLFKQVAFENGKEPENSSIVAAGKEIVEKCYGVPLAIKTIGRSLYLKNEAEWLSFKSYKLPKKKETDILPTLKLSYDQLPSHLKQCFAYCSIFPKDYVMEKSILINLWIAQGFIKPSDQNESCLEDVGHEYFMDLLWGSFFQDAEMDNLGNVITIKMHDLMHDLAMSAAGSLITTLESKEKSVGDQKTRHVSVVSNIDFSNQILTSWSRASRIRTLLSLGGFQDLNEVSSTSYKAIFSSLKFLRVLGLHGRQLDFVPSSICKLKHLRDLDLSQNSKIKELPDSISRLQNLYSLRLSGCSSLKELPRGITKLVNLRHLYNDKCKSLNYMPRGLGQLKNLQTLSTFHCPYNSATEDSGRLSELNRLNSLRGELEIRGLRHDGNDFALDYKGANLKERHLQVLTLRWRGGENVINARDENMALEGLEPHPDLKKLSIIFCEDVRVPMWFLSLTNLVDLDLWNCRKLKYLPPLSRLPSLKRLVLGLLDEIEYVSDCSDNNELSSFSSSAFFPPLEVCHNLKGWWKRSDSYNVDVNTTDDALLLFPRLSELIIRYCPMLTSLPMFPHLKEVLDLRNARWKPVQQTITNASSSSASSTPIAFSSAPLSKLKKIYLDQIEELETLPVQNLISLQCLRIEDCPKLKSLSQGVQYLTALTSLSVTNCPVLDLGNDEHGMQWKGLKSLISLGFRVMPKLVSLPLGLQHVTSLQRLEISNCSSLLAIPEWIYNWASLERFTISGCSGLTSLPEAMSSLTTLRVLQISNCPMLDLGNGMQWKGLKSLISLDFDSIPKLVSLPLGLQHVTSLRRLQISACSSLVAIPEWIYNWASLERCTISGCSGLTSLPEAMRRLTSLKLLRIHDCPILLRRCDLGGEDRPKIAHIPKLDFRFS